MTTKYILAHDIGTGGNKAVIYDDEGNLLAKSFHPYPTSYPQPGWMEQAPLDWWKAIVDGTRKVISEAHIDKSQIACISFSGTGMGIVPVDKKGNLLRNSTMIWSDSRSVAQVKKTFEKVENEQWYRITGAGVGPELYSGFKQIWLKEKEPDLFHKTYMFLGTKDYIVLRLTGKFLTDYSDACGSGLFDLKTWDYSPELIKAFGLSREKLPPPHPSIHIAGELLPEPAKELDLPSGTPIVLGGEDVPSTAVGAGNVVEGRTFNYIGSSGWIAVAGHKPLLGHPVRTYIFCHVIPKMYTSQVAIYSAGTSYQWVRNNICQPEIASAKNLGLDPYNLMEIEASSSPVSSRKLLFLPSLMGGGTLHLNPNLRGAFLGLDIGHNKADLIRSAMEGITLDMRLILDEFKSMGVKVPEMRVVGGGGKSKLWRQILADVYNTKIILTNIGQEAAALGAAVVGGVAVGLWKDFTVVDKITRVVSVSEPNPENVQKYEEILPIFKSASEQMGKVCGQLAELK
ncbi:MAG: FGGY-family carbohydrate kinase [Candidatus Aerophobetes bacterium]|nr:FGGY-family carbohydrate kinase [Candidatus Aerophobetes bacterium]